MIAGFMGDQYLQEVAQLIVHISQPLEDAYYKALKAASSGWHAQATFAADRSLGQYVRTVHAVLATVQTELSGLHNALRMTRAARRAPPEELPAWAKKELELLRTCRKFATCLASNIWWSNAHYSMAMPDLVATVNCHDPTEMNSAMAHARSLISTIVDAEGRSCADAAWPSLMADLGWNKQQLARESMALLIQSDYDRSNSELKKLAKRLFMGSASTKDTLESTFAFLHRKAATHSTNFKMSDPCKWLYSIVSPYAETGGCPQLYPDKADFDTVLGPNGIPDRTYASDHLFSIKKTILPKPAVLHRPKNIKESKWRNSGPLAQQRAAAAAAYLIRDKDTRWSNVDLCWIGSLFKLGAVFKNTNDEQYILSMGFRKWAAVGYPLEKITHHDQDYLVLQPVPAQRAWQHMVWLTCFELRGPWKLIPCEPALRAFLPTELLNRQLTSPLRIVNAEGLPLLEGALREGVFLTLADLKQLCAMLEIDLPTKGSGKKGRVLKVDICHKLICTLFPQEGPAESRRMVAAMCFNHTRALSENEEEILKCVSQLAEEDRECHEFKKVAQLARTKLQEQDRKRAVKQSRDQDAQPAQPSNPEAQAASAVRAVPKPESEAAPAERRARESAPRQPGQTPNILRDMLRSSKMQEEATLLYNPKYGYKASYPSSLALN
ncbi:rplM [Symbiodinium sp. CCMP2456]|nr:rplM [Symbiodinium sp. CCMP2456]